MRRKLNSLKKIQNTYRPDRAGKVIDLTGIAKPGCPEWLDDVGKQTWERVTSLMDGAGLSFDVELMATFCDCYAHSIKCSEKLRNEGYTITSDSGLSKINPVVNALRELHKTLIEAGKQLCLSVDARSKAGIVFKQEKCNPLTEFLKSGRDKAGGDKQ